MSTNQIIKKRIVHAIFSMTNGGAENMLIDIMNEQVKTMEVHLIVMNTNHLPIIMDRVNAKVKTNLLNRKVGSKNPFYIIKFNRLLLSLNPDVIHCHDTIFGSIIFCHRSKSVLTVHDVNKPLFKFSNYGKIIAISDAVKADINTRSRKVLNPQTVHNAINFCEISTRSQYKAIGKYKLVQISRLIHQKKGQDVLIEAMRILVNDFQLTNISLDIIGIGPSKDFLLKLIEKYQLQDYISIVEGKGRDWIYPRLKNYEMLIQPSRYEGFGLTVVEGVAAKIPVIASALDGPQEILCNGKYGELFESGNANSLAQKILLIISEYRKGLVEKRVNEAYKYCSSSFSIPVMVAGYKNVYESLKLN